jgi:hypothetical protein
MDKAPTNPTVLGAPRIRRLPKCTKISCGFLWTGFHSSDKQHYSGSLLGETEETMWGGGAVNLLSMPLSNQINFTDLWINIYEGSVHDRTLCRTLTSQDNNPLCNSNLLISILVANLVKTERRIYGKLL